MKPIAIFRHSPTEGPGYFATYLEAHSIDWKLVRVDAGEAAPASADEFSGLAFMGGPMSVNDDLPWIPRVLQLIRAAVEQDEMTPEMVRSWCQSGKREIERSACATVTPVSEIESHLQPRASALNGVAARLYDRWITGLKDRRRP